MDIYLEVGWAGGSGEGRGRETLNACWPARGRLRGYLSAPQTGLDGNDDCHASGVRDAGVPRQVAGVHASWGSQKAVAHTTVVGGLPLGPAPRGGGGPGGMCGPGIPGPP